MGVEGPGVGWGGGGGGGAVFFTLYLPYNGVQGWARPEWECARNLSLPLGALGIRV